jgi:hypothetical protein
MRLQRPAAVICWHKNRKSEIPLNTLRRYVQALGDEFSLEVRVQRRHAVAEPVEPPRVHQTTRAGGSRTIEADNGKDGA